MPYRKNRLSNQERFPQRQAPSMSETRSYVYKGRVPAARSAVGDGELRTLAYGHDALESIRAVVSHGTVQEQYHYDAFGKPFRDELETDERGYNGKPYDAVLGHYNYGFRDYDPMTGRFATVDPIRDGRNWYVYTTNDPVNFIDPWGLAAEDGSARGTIYNDYVEGLQKFNSFKPAYVLMENVGALGSYSVSGYFKITEDKDSAYTMPITAIGNTEANANNAGDVKIDGQVDIIMNDKVVHTEPLKQPIDPYIISQSSHMIGEASVRLPPQEQAIDFEIELVTALSVSSPNSVATTRRSKTPLRITKK